ncbi:hypothetical protein KCU70_g393, partial [Aureobasidium melanogenum]
MFACGRHHHGWSTGVAGRGDDERLTAFETSFSAWPVNKLSEAVSIVPSRQSEPSLSITPGWHCIMTCQVRASGDALATRGLSKTCFTDM